ncbi:DUF4920 domain-containing protein [Psychroflexus sp. CAK8W]|uniref:DUF4920 domain-containing protein n=1 Tax=Psychroflexus longus TaxID=2873596 RepID=A0ABS7XKB2_9FLAO|nr:DUF4920 domain-containing protein [Psychroflexus longus]MBZ9779415.1 DUF4920 domain-containing protein [Psychroflexus longus]
MKNLILLLILLMILACGQNHSKQEHTTSETTTENTSQEKDLSIQTDKQFGDEFELAEVKTGTEMLATYQSLKPGDTLKVQFQSEVQSVCAKKGCWMKLDLPDDQNAHVTFKDYGFFVPKDSQGHNMLVNGVAFIEQTDVETLKHYAEDAGKSEAEIAKITEPKLNYRFIAEGAKAVK